MVRIILFFSLRSGITKGCLQHKNASAILSPLRLCFCKSCKYRFFRSRGMTPNYPSLRFVRDCQNQIRSSKRYKCYCRNLIGFPEECALLKYIPKQIQEGSKSASLKLKLTMVNFRRVSIGFSELLQCNKAKCFMLNRIVMLGC